MRLLSLVISTCLSTTALATSFYERPFPESVQDAPVIVRGRVGMVYTNWGVGPDGARRIYTYTELQLDEVLKGRVSGQTVIVRELGGQKDGVGMEVSGTARFERGEDVVVFLAPANNDGSHDVRGMMMGKFDVERLPDGSEVLSGPGLGMSTRGGHDHHEVHPRGEEEGESRGDTSRKTQWGLDDLRQLIRSQGAPPPEKQNSPKSPRLAEPLARPSPVTAQPDQAAPGLQPSQNREPELQVEGSSWVSVGLIGGAIVLALLAGVLMGIRRRR